MDRADRREPRSRDFAARRASGSSLCAIVLSLGMALGQGLTSGMVAAAELAISECLVRMNEMVALRELGTQADMAIGPEAARSRLTPAQLERIARYLDVEADLAFRCPELGENELLILRRTPLPERRPARGPERASEPAAERVANAPADEPSEQPVPARRPATAAATGSKASTGTPASQGAAPATVPEPVRPSRAEQPVPTRKPRRT